LIEFALKRKKRERERERERGGGRERERGGGCYPQAARSGDHHMGSSAELASLLSHVLAPNHHSILSARFTTSAPSLFDPRAPTFANLLGKSPDVH
jgi:hypothetical protein